MDRPLSREELQAIKVAVRSGQYLGWTDTQIDARIQDVHSGAYAERLNNPPRELAVADLGECFRCGGACGSHQCMEGMKRPGERVPA